MKETDLPFDINMTYYCEKHMVRLEIRSSKDVKHIHVCPDCVKEKET